jgi:crotonobetainyl-CoA:carnitine CoA-transferase CaiB-like acyl-CoA transferase
LDVLNKIIESSDVLVENYIPGTLKKYGLDYQSLSQKKPDLIYASITGIYLQMKLTKAMDRLGRIPREQATMSWLKQRWD